MITWREEQLPMSKEASIRQWLNQGECQQLRELAESALKRHLAQAGNESLQANTFSAKEAALSESIRRAERLKIFLETLDEFKTPKAPYVLFRLN